MPRYLSACNTMNKFSLKLPVLDIPEQAILEDLRCVRDELTLLKMDRSNYIKSPDIISLFDRTVKQVQLLNNTRAKMLRGNNQVDQMLDSCLQLLSLFFMTIGRNNEAPAVYALTSTIKRFLDHLAEADVYSSKDLTHISDTLDKLRGVVEKTHGSYPQRLITLLLSQIDLCVGSLKNLQNCILQIHGDLHPVYEKLISISNLISSTSTRKNFSLSEIQKLRNQLIKIDKQRSSRENFVAVNGEVLNGSNIVGKILDDCLVWSELVLERREVMPEDFKHTYQKLLDIRDKLARLTLTHAWSLREADLYDYQRELDIIDNSRVDRVFLDKNGNPAEPYVQRIFLYLIRKSYRYIYYIMVASEPVSEELLPVYNQLQTLKRCLIRLKNSGGISCKRELYPCSMKLQFIERMRVDGKFYVEDSIPEGQVKVNGLLEQCYELIYQLQEKASKRVNSHSSHVQS